MSTSWYPAAEKEEDADDRVRGALRDENHYSYGVAEDMIAERCEQAGYKRADK
jgi:hypothetical protein